MSGVASIAQSSTSTPPRSSVLPSLGLSPSTLSSSVTITSIPVQLTICVDSSTPVVMTQSSGYFHTRRSIVLNPTWLVNQVPSRSQARALETAPAGAATTNPMVSTYTFDEHMLDIHRRYAPSPDSHSPEAMSVSSMISTVPMIPSSLTFEEYFFVVQQ